MTEEPEDELEEMEQRSEELKKEIEETSEDWEAKKQDSAVPGAVEEPLDEDNPVDGV